MVDQKVYDDFYPEDIVITFNADGNVCAAGENFTATEKSTGRVLLSNQPYTPGQEITLAGVAVKLAAILSPGLRRCLQLKHLGQPCRLGRLIFLLAHKL